MSKRPIVGIITVPLSPGRKYYKVCGDSYISTAHIEWLQEAGLDVLPIPFDTDKHKYYFERVNGLYLPSGGVFASNSKEYYQCCKTFVKMAIAANDAGDYFPIWGGCMGMQQMMIIADGQDNMKLLETFDSFNNLMLPLIMTDQGLDSRMLSQADEKYVMDLMTKDITLNNHMMGLSPEKFLQSSLLRNFYHIVSYNYDRKGKIFVSTIEGKDHPFFGVQWHPERAANMKHFAVFFGQEVRKNNHHKKVPESKLMEYKKVDCMTYSGSIYKNCNFYWHKRTSEHNKRLCSVLNLGSPVNNSV